MDSNGTRFHLLLGLADWETCAVQRYDPPGADESPAWWDAEWQAVRLPSRHTRFCTSPRDVLPGLASRRGAGVDAYGNWYWIDDDARGILVKSSGSGTVAPFWRAGDAAGGEPAPPAGDFAPAVAPGPPTPLALAGLVVTTAHYLIAGVTAPAGLLIFDLHAGGTPRFEPWFAGFAPFDMAPAPDGGFWLLERDAAASRRLWRFDRRLRVRRLLPAPPSPAPPLPAFLPADGSPPGSLPDCSPAPAAGPDPTAAWPLAGRPDLIAVEGLPDGTALLLSSEPATGEHAARSRLWRFASDAGLRGPFQPVAERGLIAEGGRASDVVPFAFAALDLAFVPARGERGAPPNALRGRLLLAEHDGNQALAFALKEPAGGPPLALDIVLLPEFRPMRLFGGKGLVTAGDAASYDSGRDWVPLVEQPRRRYDTELRLTTALIPDPESVGDARHAFDGREPDCVWHRLLLDCCLPPTASIAVRSRAANSEQELAITDWRAEPPPYRRRDGAELPYVRQEAGRDWGTLETLFQAARGRFLQLEITLRGDGRTSPRLRAARAYYPRFSYLEHYLPAVYRLDAPSASFLDRFLANLEGTMTGIEDRIALVRALMDVRSAPPGYLDWLAGWFGATLDPYWDEARRRLFIAYAPELFAQRGTLPGLIRAIRLATDPCPDASIFTAPLDELLGAGRPSSVRIIEQFRTRGAPGLIFGDPAGAEGPGLSSGVSDWTPREGAAPLHARYQGFLRRRYAALAPADPLGALNTAWGSGYAGFERIELPPVRPTAPAAAADWERFLRAGLGFTYAPVGAADLGRYQRFLARRYHTIDAYNRAYGRAGMAARRRFAEIPFPPRLPASGTALRDWMQFASLLLPTERNAHRFTVLVPALAGEPMSDRAERSERVRRVVAREKPAHTTFDIREYWAAFRVGEARLGFDTLLDQGSRLLPAVLGRGGLAEGFLSYPHPWSAADRVVLDASIPPWPEDGASGPAFANCPCSPGEMA